jgi:hypothetical protein
MALVVNDRVQQTGTANTTVSFTLTGTVLGYQSFAVIGNGNTTFYAATDVSGNWEVGVGTYSTTGPTLTRTTILSSSNSGSAVTFSGTVNVFVTYPSEQSVNLDASGNVTALGTITSGVWNGSTLPVAYGGTGVTASSGANSVMLRDANQNVAVNRLNQANTNTTAAGGTTALTAASTYSQTLNGTGNQTYTMPDATTLTTGVAFVFNNNATGTLTLQDYSAGSIGTITPGGAVELVLLVNGTVGGTWDVHGFLPENVTWGTNALNLGSTVITNGTWQGGTIQPAYGGTGLTTFTAANNALYSTGATTLTAGTLPVAAGGTGVTSATANGLIYGNGTSALQVTAAGTTGQVLLGNTGSAPSWGSVPASSITGTVPIANGGTGQTTAAAAFNALSPLTTTGDIIYEASASTAARLPVGSAGQVLTVAGGIPSWATPSTGAGTITRTDFTATSGQTVFSVVYTVGLIDVYQNGAKLAQADFTATNGTSFTLATGATAGDLIQAEVFSSLNIYSTITAETFNGTGSQTIFTMSAVPANSASLLVAISGVVQDPTTYTVSSNTLTFSTAPPSGTGNVAVRYLGVQSVSTVSSFSAGTTGFTPATATTGGVVLAGTLATTNGGTGLTAVGTNGQVLTSNGTTLSYQTPVSTPGGSNTQVQYNSGGAFAGDADFTFNGTTVTMANDASISGLTVGKGGGSAANSTVVGGGALAATNTGDYASAFGRYALAANTSGVSNSAFGYASLGNTTTGSYNTGFGQGTLQANTTASYNTATGLQALYLNTTGNSNTASGYQSLFNNTTASSNTAVGYQAKYLNATGGNSSAVGYQALYSDTGDWNTAIGHQAAYSNTSGKVTAIGALALQANTTGNANVAVGGYDGSGATGLPALYSNTTGSSNTAIGVAALKSNTTASNNTAVGYQAGYANTTGYNQSALGYQALYANTTGVQNTAIGQGALQNNTTANNNTAVGAASLLSNTTGSSNASLGFQALYSNTTSSNIVAIGYQALYSGTTNIPNSTAVGYQAGYSANQGTNTYIGAAAGYNSTGYYNTFVGAGGQTGGGAGYAMTTGIGNTILGGFSGNNGGLDIRTASNYIVLSDGTGNPREYFDGSGNRNTYCLGTSAGVKPAYDCRAWVKWDGTNGSVFGSGNISSVTRVSAGIYTVNFTTAMTDTNYGINISASSVSGSGATDAIVTTVSDSNNNGNPTTGLFKLSTRSLNGTPLDPTFCFASVFR